MSSNKLETRKSEALKEKSQYAVAFGVIAMMLYITGFPAFVILFFGVLAYFIWKTLASPVQSGTRDIFEFYLLSNEILRDDERRWYGFEVREVIAKGERIVHSMSGAPPLVYFTLGALYHKIGDHKSAVNHLAFVYENETSDEHAYLYPTPELREYVKTLRKIERDPAEAPLMSSAVRALERSRRNRGPGLLEQSRREVEELLSRNAVAEIEENRKKAEIEATTTKVGPMPSVTELDFEPAPPNGFARAVSGNGKPAARESREAKDLRKKKKADEELYANRKSISEVLHDIYDAK